MIISYQLELPEGPPLRFDIDTERTYVPPASGAAWAKLDFHKCPNCPLSADHAHCPAAIDTQPLMDACGGLFSYSSVRVRVELGERRTLAADCDLQTALTSVLGLLMSTSGCPIVSRLRGMARQHLPFQTLEESQLRMVGAWLVGRMLENDLQGSASLQGLHELVQAIGLVNRSFMNRLRAAASKDANLNALATLAASAMNVEFSLEDDSVELERFAIK